MGRVFANGPGDLGSIPGRVIPNTFKMVLDTFLLNTQQYKVCIEGKVEQSKERSNPPLHLYSSYWKGSLLVALDYGRQFCLLILIPTYINTDKYQYLHEFMSHWAPHYSAWCHIEAKSFVNYYINTYIYDYLHILITRYINTYFHHPWNIACVTLKVGER